MDHLADCHEMVGNFSKEVKQRLTKLEEIELAVNSDAKLIEKRMELLFKNADKMSPAERDAEFQAICSSYSKIMESSDEKILMTEQICDKARSCLRSLDEELRMFKGELDDYYPGTTEKLEQEVKDENYLKKTHELPSGTSKIIQVERPQQGLNPPLKYKNSQSAFIKKTIPSATLSADLKSLSISSLEIPRNVEINQNTCVPHDIQQGIQFKKCSSLPSLSILSSKSFGPMMQGSDSLIWESKSSSSLSSSIADKLLWSSSSEDTLGVLASSSEDEYEIPSNKVCSGFGRCSICKARACGNMIICPKLDCPLKCFHSSCVTQSSSASEQLHCPCCKSSVVMYRPRDK